MPRCLALFLLLSSAACGGQSLHDAQPVTDGGSTGTDAPGVCARESSAAEAALAKVSLDETCAADTDCAWAATPSCVATGCGGSVVNQTTASALGAVVSEVNATVCTPDCTYSSPPCAGGLGGPACIGGTCQVGVSASWSSLHVEKVPAGTDCTISAGCTSWQITPDGAIVSSASGTKTLSAADFATVDGILRNSLRLSAPPACASGVGTGTGASVTFTIDRPNSVEAEIAATNCVEGGAGGNDVERVYEVVTGY